VVLVVVIGGYALYRGTTPPDEVETETRQITSIAVLPLKNMIGDPEQLYFTDGMHDALINNLSKIGALRVISNTSVMQYRDNPKPIPVIARELDVDAVIEGSVFRADNQVRIIVQLIATNPERHLWSNEYTRELRNVMSLQNEVAQAIAGEIEVTVTPEEEDRLIGAHPVDPEAYDYYLRGNDYYRGSEEDDMRITVRMYQKAVELDSTFALAYAKLSQTQSRMYAWRYDRSESCLTEAKENVDKALHLDPELPEAYLALGYYYYWGRMEFDRALEQFAIVRESQPNNGDLLEAIGYVQRRQEGKMEEALANLRKASDLDPLSAMKAYGLAETYGLLRNYPEAERHIDRALSLAPDDPYIIADKATIHLYHGDTGKARAALEEAPGNLDASLYNLIGWFNVYPLGVYDGNYREALDQLSRVSSENFDTHNYFITKAQLSARIYGLINDTKREKAYYDSARVILEARISEQPEDARFHSSLGIVYAGLGRKEEAIREGKLAAALRPVSREALAGLCHIEDLARISVMTGEYDSAIDRLEFLLSRPGSMTTHLLRLDPDWAPLRNHPRFRELLDTYAVRER